MLILRMTVTQSEKPHHFHIDLALSGDRAASLTVEDIPFPSFIAAESELHSFGIQLGSVIFPPGSPAFALLQDGLKDARRMRLEIAADPVAASLPWEWMSAPETTEPLSSLVGEFVRVPFGQVNLKQYPTTPNGEPVRTLLVIPRLGQGAPVHSLGMRWVRALCERCRSFFDLTILRPACVNELVDALRQAKAKEKPFHLLHVDAPIQMDEDGSVNLILEGLEEDQVERLSDRDLAKWLAENGVPLFSYYYPLEEHPHPEQIKWIDRLSQTVLQAGILGVVAFPAGMDVIAAAKFAGDIFAAMAQGETLGESAGMGRRLLHAQAEKDLTRSNLAPLPLVYEAGGAVRLFPKIPFENAPIFRIVILDESAEKAPPRIDPHLLGKLPAIGFIGREETLLALDRAFEYHPVVLLQGEEGMGKTSTAAAFARWLMTQGWLEEGAVLYSSFNHYLPLSHALEAFGSAYKDALKGFGVEWSKLNEHERRWTVIRVLQKAPVFWVWDDIESVAGSSSYPSPYTEKERQDLLSFLKDASEQKGKFLLLSANAEDWLGELPFRLALPTLSLTDRRRMAEVQLTKDGSIPPSQLERLLRLSAGIPLVQKLISAKILRYGQDQEKIAQYLEDVANLSAGLSEAGSRSMVRALLQYNLEQDFTAQERKILGLLGLFQNLVDVDVLKAMAKPGTAWQLVEMGEISRENGKLLLNRAIDAGLLTAGKGGYYAIQPSVGWFLKEIFQQQYPSPQDRQAACYAYAGAMGGVSRFYTLKYADGNEAMLKLLQLEEGNLLHARRLAHQHGWQAAAMDCLQGLSLLYDRDGRRIAWEAILSESTADFSDPETGAPLPGKEVYWIEFNEFRVRLARLKRDLDEATRLQKKRIDYDRKTAEPYIHQKPSEMSPEARQALRQLADSLYKLGEIERENKDHACIGTYMEASRLLRRLGEKKQAARCLFNLGLAYTHLPKYRNLAEAEKWFHKSMELVEEEDASWKGRCLTQIATTTYERFLDGQKANRPEEELVPILNQALEQYFDALDVIPEDAAENLATVYNMIGAIYVHAGNLAEALKYYDEAIEIKQSSGDILGAADIGFNVAIALFLDNRMQDGKQYAEAALKRYESLGSQAARQASKTRGLLVRFGFGKQPTQSS